MRKFFNRQDVVTSLILMGTGALAGFALVNFQWLQMDEAMKDLLFTQLGSKAMFLAVSSIQTAILTFITSFLGVKLSRRVGLRLNWRPALNSCFAIFAVGLVSALIISFSDKLIFAPYLPEAVQVYNFSFLYLISSVLYGGIVEEVFLRLFVMSLIVFILTTYHRRKNIPEVPAWIFIISIFLSAMLFAAGHLPATAQLLGLSAPIVIRAFLLNGLAGLGFGWLYWKHGLGSAIGAHMLTHLLMQLLIMPLAA